MSHKKAVAVTCFVAFLWSLAGFFVKAIHMPSLAMNSAKSIITAICLLPVMSQNDHIGRGYCHAVHFTSLCSHVFPVSFA